MKSFFEESPAKVNFITSYGHNSRYADCFISKDTYDGVEILSDDEITRLLYEDPLISRCHEIGFVGCETIFSPFFWRVMALIPENRGVTITTNALSTSRFLKTLNERSDRENFVVRVLFYGIGHVHDQITGIKGSYDKTIFLLERLRELKVPRIVSFTINPANFHQLISAYEIAEATGSGFSARMAFSCGAHKETGRELFSGFNEGQLSSASYSLRKIIDAEIRKNGHSRSQIVFMDKIIDHYSGKQRDIPCKAMYTGPLIDLYGNVFPNCPAMTKSLGTLKEKSFQEIWYGETADEMRKQIDDFACGGCWDDWQVVANIEHDGDFLAKCYCEIKLGPVLAAHELQDHFEMSDASFSDLMGTGWYHLEGKPDFFYRWTSVKFSLVVPGGTRYVKFFCMPASFKEVEGRVFLLARTDSGSTGKHVFLSREWHEIIIELDQTLKNNSVCFFELSHGLNPEQAFSGTDARDLGMAVKSISFIK